jgi:hypothetical protein
MIRATHSASSIRTGIALHVALSLSLALLLLPHLFPLVVDLNSFPILREINPFRCLVLSRLRHYLSDYQRLRYDSPVHMQLASQNPFLRQNTTDCCLLAIGCLCDSICTPPISCNFREIDPSQVMLIHDSDMGHGLPPSKFIHI